VSLRHILRVVSYVFHDKFLTFIWEPLCPNLFLRIQVRVPLNTARKRHFAPVVFELNFCSSVLAVQNMDASGTVAKEQEIEFNALEGSLSMMSKGLI